MLISFKLRGNHCILITVQTKMLHTCSVSSFWFKLILTLFWWLSQWNLILFYIYWIFVYLNFLFIALNIIAIITSEYFLGWEKKNDSLMHHEALLNDSESILKTSESILHFFILFVFFIPHRLSLSGKLSYTYFVFITCKVFLSSLLVLYICLYFLYIWLVSD